MIQPELAECSSCKDSRETRVLPCGHSLCSSCCVTNVSKNDTTELERCPVCLQEHPIVGERGNQPQSNLSYVENSDDWNSPLTSAKSEESQTCTTHGISDNLLFCMECYEIVCLKCVMRGAKHFKHDFVELAEGGKLMLDGYSRLQQTVQAIVSEIKAAVRGQSRSAVQLQLLVIEAVDHVNTFVDMAVSSLETLRMTLVTAVQSEAQKRAVQWRREAASSGSRLPTCFEIQRTLADITSNCSLQKMAQHWRSSSWEVENLQQQFAAPRQQALQESQLIVHRESLIELQSIKSRIDLLLHRSRGLVPRNDPKKLLSNFSASNLSENATDLLFCIGGNSSTRKQVMAYDPDVDKWYNACETKSSRYYSAATTWNNKVVVAGGVRHKDSVELYDPETNEWNELPSLLNGRSSHMLVNLRGKLFAIGGYSGKSYLNSVECFVATSQTWTEATSLVTARYGLAAASLARGIVVAGGCNSDDGALSSCELYQEASDQWTSIASMNKKRRYAVAVHWADYIFVFGGYLDYKTTYTDVEQYDRQTDKWTLLTTQMSVARRDFAASAISSRIYLVGGCYGDDVAECFDVAKRQCRRIASLPRTCNALAAVSVRVSLEALNRLRSSTK